MLMTALVDPSAFDRELFGENHYGSCVKHFFEDMVTENGLLFEDRNSGLVKSLVKRVKALPSRYGYSLQRYLETALVSTSRRCFVRLDISSNSDVDLLKRLIHQCPPDAVFTSPERVTDFKEDISAKTLVLSFFDYQDSGFQDRRRYFQRGHLDLKQIGNEMSKEVFVRTIRFATRLGIYDKQIGQANEQGIKRFIAGIDYILELWRKNGYFITQKSFGQVDIYTCERHWRLQEYQMNAGHLCENQRGVNLLRNNLIRPLQEKYCNDGSQWKIRLYVKADPRHEMHARYLDAQTAILHIDRGFDLFYRREFRANPVSFHSPVVSLRQRESVVETLRRWRSLPNARIP